MPACVSHSSRMSLSSTIPKVILSETNCVTDRFVFTWKIKDFSASPVILYRVIVSKSFSFDSSIFCLKAHFERSSQHLSVALKPESSPSGCVIYSVSLKDKNNKLRYKKYSSYFNSDIMIVKISKLMTEESKILLPNDSLTIVCELMSFGLTHGDTVQNDPAPSSRVEDLTNDLKNLFSTKENSDVVLRVEGQEILAHSAILSARSSYFSAMFKHDMLESRSREIIITDFGASAINYLLRYLYTGTLEDLKDLPGDLMTELYAAADKYVVKGLKDMCLLMMLTTLSESNIEAYTTLALMHEEQRLTDAVVKYFVRNEKLIKSDMWKKLERMYPTLAILVLNDVTKKMNKED